MKGAKTVEYESPATRELRVFPDPDPTRARPGRGSGPGLYLNFPSDPVYI
jgi:hypothetical protein